jgi:hypothetical protein
MRALGVVGRREMTAPEPLALAAREPCGPREN